MRRSNSFPGAALDDIASDKLTSRLTAQLVSPTVPSGPVSSASSDDLDSDTFAEDWAAADDASTPTRCVSSTSTAASPHPAPVQSEARSKEQIAEAPCK